ncbi:energy transducer TonB [uncultured Litoreibacter sp.]|uniref:energy transducer TonB n=1 Tax=uncultured Litoreibacter sp. TaxID=1392394 RepID=UPI00262BEC4D|nr:energy transducer TonB [uncultured Litoreibacter sp.]
MKIGTYVSGAGHAGLFVWLLIGGFFVSRDDFDAITATDVSIITAEDFQALQPSGPETGEAPPALDAPAVDQPAPALPVPDEAVEAPEAPAPVEEVQPEVQPVEVEEPAQPDVVVEEAPAQPDAPDGDPGDVVIVPDAVPVPRQEDVIAPELTETVEPEVEVDDVAQTETAPDEAAEVVTEEVDTTTSEAATTTEIVTEADEPATGAPTKSLRPGRKPTPPAPAQTEVAETPTEEPTTPGLEDLINEAVTEANSENAVADNANPGGGTGEPITRAEKGALVANIRSCWNVGAVGTDGLKVTVIVGFSLTPDAKPEIGSIRIIESDGGSGVAVEKAFEAARRAIIRCGANGYNLPPEKYDQWRNIQVRFNAANGFR